MNMNRVEVAPIRSTGSDVAGTDDGPGKGKAPKRRSVLRIVSGRRMKNPVTVIRVDGELPEDMDPLTGGIVWKG